MKRWATMTHVPSRFSHDADCIASLVAMSRNQIPEGYVSVGKPDVQVNSPIEAFRYLIDDDGNQYEAGDLVRIEFTLEEL